MLHRALDSAQTDDDSLIRILISRSEVICLKFKFDEKFTDF